MYFSYWTKGFRAGKTDEGDGKKCDTSFFSTEVAEQVDDLQQQHLDLKKKYKNEQKRSDELFEMCHTLDVQVRLQSEKFASLEKKYKDQRSDMKTVKQCMQQFVDEQSEVRRALEQHSKSLKKNSTAMQDMHGHLDSQFKKFAKEQLDFTQTVGQILKKTGEKSLEAGNWTV